MTPAAHENENRKHPANMPIGLKYSICSPTSFGRPLYHAQPSCLTPVLPRVTGGHLRNVQYDSQQTL